MTFTDIISNKCDNIIVIYSSHTGIKYIPNNMDEVWKLLDMYAHENHKHISNNFLNIGFTHYDKA
jgi:hypothetical protein